MVAEATAMVSAAGGLVIADEVQAGFSMMGLGGVASGGLNVWSVWASRWVMGSLFLQWRRTTKW